MRKSKTLSQFLLPHIFESWSQSFIRQENTFPMLEIWEKGQNHLDGKLFTSQISPSQPSKRPPSLLSSPLRGSTGTIIAWDFTAHSPGLHFTRDAIESISTYQMSVGSISRQLVPGRIINHHADADWCISFHCVDGMIHISVIHSFHKKVWMIDKTRVSSKKFAILPDYLVPHFFTNHTTATLLISKDVCGQNQTIKPSAVVTTDMLTSFCGFKPATPIA